MYLGKQLPEEEDHISTDNLDDVPLRKRVTQSIRKVNKRSLARFGKKAAKFSNKQFAFIVIAFFVLSLNVVSAPASVDTAAINPLINYNPIALAAAAQDITPYIPVLSSSNPDQIHDQVLSSVVGAENSYVPKPMLAETIDSKTAERIRRGLRHETVQHQVQQGETMGKIAKDYGINVATLLEANSLSAQDTLKIRPGMTLTVPPENTTESLAWLDTLHEEERKAREEAERQRQARLAQQAATRSTGVTVARAASNDEPVVSTPGRFGQPIGTGTRYNGYHWWATDHPAPVGTPIRASATGVVVSADASGYNGGYGQTILLDHGNGWQTRYAHMSQLYVSPGERVSAGQTIGANGNTGRSTGPHLHFEIIRNGQRLNPCSYIGC